MASPSPEQFLEFQTSNCSVWCILEWKILRNRLLKEKVKSAKKRPIWAKGATTLQTLRRSESDEARIRGTKRLRFEGEARIEGEFSLDPSNPHPFSGLSPRKGGGSWEGAWRAPPRNNFWNFKLQIVQSGVY